MKIKLKSRYIIWKNNRFEKKPFKRRMKEWLTWHIPFTKDDKNYYDNNGDRNHYCPNCGTDEIKNNGEGFFRCRKCQNRFIILISTEKGF